MRSIGDGGYHHVPNQASNVTLILDCYSFLSVQCVAKMQCFSAVGTLVTVTIPVSSLIGLHIVTHASKEPQEIPSSKYNNYTTKLSL